MGFIGTGLSNASTERHKSNVCSPEGGAGDVALELKVMLQLQTCMSTTLAQSDDLLAINHTLK